MRDPAKKFSLLLRFLVLAILINALAPTFLSVQASAVNITGTASGFADICSIIKVKASPGGDPAQPAQSTSSHVAHCELCVSRVDPLIPSLSLPRLLLVSLGFASFPPLYTQAPKGLFIWAASQARAPPRSS